MVLVTIRGPVAGPQAANTRGLLEIRQPRPAGLEGWCANAATTVRWRRYSPDAPRSWPEMVACAATSAVARVEGGDHANRPMREPAPGLRHAGEPLFLFPVLPTI